MNCNLLSSLKVRRATLIEGDGIGPEISQAVREIFSAAQVSVLVLVVEQVQSGSVSPQVPVEWEPVSVRPVKNEDGSTTVPPEVIDSLTKNRVGLKGVVCVVMQSSD